MLVTSPCIIASTEMSVESRYKVLESMFGRDDYLDKMVSESTLFNIICDSEVLEDITYTSNIRHPISYSTMVKLMQSMALLNSCNFVGLFTVDKRSEIYEMMLGVNIIGANLCVCGECPELDGFTYFRCGPKVDFSTPRRISQLNYTHENLMKLTRKLSLPVHLNIFSNNYIINTYLHSRDITSMTDDPIEATREFLIRTNLNIYKSGFKKYFLKQRVCGCGSCACYNTIYWTELRGIPHLTRVQCGLKLFSLTHEQCPRPYVSSIKWLSGCFSNTQFSGLDLTGDLFNVIPQNETILSELSNLLGVKKEHILELIERPSAKSKYNKLYGTRNMMVFILNYNYWAANTQQPKIKWHVFKDKAVLKKSADFRPKIDEFLHKTYFGEEMDIKSFKRVIEERVLDFIQIDIPVPSYEEKPSYEIEKVSSAKYKIDELFEELEEVKKCFEGSGEGFEEYNFRDLRSQAISGKLELTSKFIPYGGYQKVAKMDPKEWEKLSSRGFGGLEITHQIRNCVNYPPCSIEDEPKKTRGRFNCKKAIKIRQKDRIIAEAQVELANDLEQYYTREIFRNREKAAFRLKVLEKLNPVIFDNAPVMPKDLKECTDLVDTNNMPMVMNSTRTQFFKFIRRSLMEKINRDLEPVNWRVNINLDFYLIRPGSTMGYSSNFHKERKKYWIDKYQDWDKMPRLKEEFEALNDTTPVNFLKSAYNGLSRALIRKTKNRSSRIRIFDVEPAKLLQFSALAVLGDSKFRKFGKENKLSSSNQKRLVGTIWSG